MKVVIEFDALSYTAGQFKKIVELDCPLIKDGTTYDMLTCDDKDAIMNWLDLLDKYQIMLDNNFDSIITYDIVEPDYEVKQLARYVEYLHKSNAKLAVDFMVVYQDLLPTIQKLPIETRLAVAIHATGLTYDAATAAYQHMIDYSKNLEGMTLEELTNLQQNKLKRNE